MEQHLERKKVTIKNVETEAWELLHQMRHIEQRMLGVIISDCIAAYWADNYGEQDND